MKKLLFFFIIFISSVMYSQQIDPSTQINWPNITGNGSPMSNNCTINSVGMMYTDKTNNIEYFCGINGWFSTSSSVNLTTTGTSGAATLSGNILNIPQYQGAITLTTTGTSGAATLSGNILNIPQYLGVSSLNSLSGEVNLTSTDSSVTITPSGSTINLQAAVGSSSVQYNPTSTAYILTGSSVMSDDNKNFSPAIPISSWSCNGTICTVTSTSAHGLVAGNWVDLGTMSNWFPIPINRGYEDTGIGSFQVLSAGLTSTSFEVSYTLNTGSCSSSCGSAYNANYWGVYTAAKEPYLNGHGTTYYAWTPIANLAANFSTVINCSLGNPTYLIIEGGQNDLYSSVPVSTIESDFQSIWAQAHAAGCIIIQGTILPTNYGATGGLASVWIGTGQLNTWLVQQSKTSTTITTGAYWDKFIDFTANELNASLGMLGSDAQGAAWFGERINEAVGTQGGSYPTMSMWGPANSNGYSIAFYPNDFVFYDRNWYQYAEFRSDGQYLSLTASDPYISVDPLLKQWWPNTLAGQSVCTQMGVNTSNNNGFSLCMKYAGDGSTSNYFSIGSFGESTTANFFANGNIQFPELSSSSGNNCLQVDATGNITNTGSACGSGNLPLSGGTLTGSLFGTDGIFSGMVQGATNLIGTTKITSGNATGICQAASAVGFLLNGTDETATFNSWLSSVNTNGGGCLAIDAGKTLRIDGQVTFPKQSTSPWTMPTIRITGAGPAVAFDDSHTTAPPPGSALDLRYAGSRFISLGLGTLKIDNLVVINGGTSCGTFFQTTLTNLQLEGDSFWGGAGSGTTSCDDVWLAGGTNQTSVGLTGTINDYFQGYGSYVKNNFAQRIRQFVFGRVAFNSIAIENNHIGGLSGSNSTATVTAATNASPTILTSTGHNFGPGNIIPLNFSGFTGNWAVLNGTQLATITDADHFSVAIDTTSFGAMSGSPVYLNGAAITIDGSVSSGTNFIDTANYLASNTIEMQGYPFGFKIGVAQGNVFTGNQCPDPVVFTAGCMWDTSAAGGNYINDQSQAQGTSRTLLAYNINTQDFSSILNPFYQTISGPIDQNIQSQYTGAYTNSGTTKDQYLTSGQKLCRTLEYDGGPNDAAVWCFTFIGQNSSSNYVSMEIPSLGTPFKFKANGAFNAPGGFQVFDAFVIPSTATGYAGGSTDVNVQMNGNAACVYPDIATYDSLGGTNCQTNTTLDSNGVKHEGGAAPTSSVGTLTGTNAGGYVVGLSGATTLTITFANGGWNSWSSCTGTPGAPLATTPYVSDIGKTSVTFTFPALTGLFYYQCTGN